LSTFVEFHYHTDFDLTLSGEAYAALFPLQLMESSPPELVIQEQGTGKVHSFQYEKGCAYLWGPNTLHATATINYPDAAFRLCVSLSLGHITLLNAKVILRDISQQYTPKRENFLLELATNAHWRRTGDAAECVLPEIDEYDLYMAKSG
jgi:hypothetical protein